MNASRTKPWLLSCQPSRETRAAIVVDLVWIVLALAGLAVAVMPWTCATLADAE
jgi:hypothetical protein